jgi:hypothetical protein
VWRAAAALAAALLHHKLTAVRAMTHTRACLPRRLEFDDVFLVDVFADSPVGPAWRVLLQVLHDLEAAVEVIAKYAAALVADGVPVESIVAAAAASSSSSSSSSSGSSGGQAAAPPPPRPRTWQQLAEAMTAGDMRRLMAAAREGRAGSSGAAALRAAAAAVDAYNKTSMLHFLPTSARLTPVAAAEADVAAGWLRPLAFDQQQHSLLCEELKHLYVGLTRAKNWAVFFDTDGQQRAPLYHFLRRLDLGSHVTSVVRGGLEGKAKGTSRNKPLECECAPLLALRVAVWCLHWGARSAGDCSSAGTQAAVAACVAAPQPAHRTHRSRTHAPQGPGAPKTWWRRSSLRWRQSATAQRATCCAAQRSPPSTRCT